MNLFSLWRISAAAAARIGAVGIAVAAAAASLPAQSAAPLGALAGTVVDSASGASLPGTRLELLEPHRVEFSHSGGDWAFRAVPVGTYTLSVSRVGYAATTRRVSVRAGETAQLRVALGATATALQGIVVTGTLGPRAGRDVLSPTSALGGAELDRRLESTVAATLEGTPGVSVSGIGPSTGRPVIRGLSGDRVLVLEDGQRPGDLSSTSGDHAVAIEGLTARRLEVVRGPMSLLYGSSALGGVVNVVREEIPTQLPEDTHGTFSVQGTSVDRGGVAGGYGTGQVGRIALRGEASGRHSGDVHTPFGTLPNTATRSVNLSAGAAYVAGDRGHAGGSYRFYDNNYGIPGGFVGGHENGVDIRMRRHTGRAEGVLHPDGKAFSTVRLTGGFTDYAHQELEKSGRVGTQFGQRMATGELFGQHEQWGPLAEGALGVRVQARDITTGGSLRTPPTRDLNLAAYLVEQWSRGPLRLQAGARYDWTRFEPQRAGVVNVGGAPIPIRPRTFGSLSGSLGALYSWGDAVQVGASVARAFRTPDFNELYSNGPHLAANSFDVGDPDLEQETGLGLDAFVRVDRGDVHAEVAAFTNQLDGFISPGSRGRAALGNQAGRPLFQYTNEDARFRGAEAQIEWQVAPRVTLDGTASYVEAEFTRERAPIPAFEVRFDRVDTVFTAASRYPSLIPPLNGRVGARYEDRRWFGGAETRWSARQARTGDFEEPTAGYTVANAFAGVRLLRGRQLHTLTLRADNLLDTEYREHLSRIKAIMPEPGRSLSLLYRVSF